VATLRPPDKTKQKVSDNVFESQFKTMTTMQLLGHGLATPLHRQNGWLKALLLQEGTQIFSLSTFRY
jgi:hypothetical protein